MDKGFVMRRNFLFCVVLFASLVSRAVDWTGDVALPGTVAVGDRCEATASPPGHVVSGGQVLGCDWPWANSNRNFASWHSHYPANPAQQHGVRFEGEYVPIGSGGAGGGIPRIYEWALNVTDPHKTCDYSLFSEIPPQTKCPGPTIKSPPTDVPCSFIPESGNPNPLFRIMYVHIVLKGGEAPGVDEFFADLPDSAYGWYLPDYPQIPDVAGDPTMSPPTTKPCGNCHVGTVSGYDIGFPQLHVASWVSEIFIATWKEMETYAGTNTCAAMAKHHELVLRHETKHHDQFVKYYAKPLMDAIDNLNATYHFEYCSLAFEASEMSETAENDAISMHERRYLLMLRLFESWDDYFAAAAALDAIDCPLIDNEMPADIKINE